MLKQIDVSIPPRIAERDPYLDRATRAAVDQAQIAAVRLDATSGKHLAALSGFLLRSESVASSKIERINPDPNDSAKAFAGLSAGVDARLVAAAAKAVSFLINSPAPLNQAAICEAHRLLMADEPLESGNAGAIRRVQNWIGGSDFTPRNAIYVPPPVDLVESLIDDLVVFAGRTDFGAVAQAAVVHAQFESIHPFTDGNGRTGRALINTILRHRGVTSHLVIPAASVMLADIEAYFAKLRDYQDGNVDALVRFLADGIVVACESAEASAKALFDLPDEWRDQVRPRANSSVALLLEVLPANPVLTRATASQLIGTTPKATAAGLDKLEEEGVLIEITGASRDRVWLASDVLDEIDRLHDRIGDRQAPQT